MRLRPLSHQMIALIFFAAAPVASLQAQPAAAAARDTVDRFIAAEMARRHIPGVSLAVVRAGKVIKAEGNGVADLENEIAVTPRRQSRGRA